VGVALPVGGTRDSAELAAGVELDLRMQSPLRDAELSLSADWMGITSRRGLRVRDVDLVPVLLNARWERGLRSKSWYFGGGLGATYASGRIPEVNLSSELNFGWQVFGGYHFTPRIRGDVRFVASDDPGEDGVFLVQAGYRL
jgi:hypothetical protein